MKSKVVVMAFDDGPHDRRDLHHHFPFWNQPHQNDKNQPPTTNLIGVVCRGLQLLHVAETSITVDGIDSTEKILEMVAANPFRAEIRLLFIDSPTLGGFNPPNAYEIWQQSGCPVVLIPDRKPQSHIADVYRNVFPTRRAQIEYLQALPPLQQIPVSINTDPQITSDLFLHAIGIDISEIGNLLEHLTHFSHIPEPLRLAHLIASKESWIKKE